MEIRNGTQVLFGFASKDEEAINFLRDTLSNHHEGSYNVFLRDLAEDNNIGIQFDGTIQHDRIKVYERVMPEKNSALEEWHYIIFEFDAKGFVSSDLGTLTNQVLTKRFGANKVKFYFLDEYRRVNSDEYGIIFPWRIKVEFSLLGHPRVRTEYYHSVEELAENKLFAPYGLDDIYEMAPDELSEIVDEIEDKYDNIFTIKFTAYKYGYEAASNVELAKFYEVFD